MVFGNAEERAALIAPVAGLAVQQQDLIHAGAGLALDLAVQLDKGHAPRRGKLRTKRGLAGAAQPDERNALLAALGISQAKGAGQQGVSLVKLHVVQPGQQALSTRERGARRILQQLKNRDVQRPGCSFQRIDGDIALAAFHVGQEPLAQARVCGQLLACHAAPCAPSPDPRAQLAERGPGILVRHDLHDGVVV